MTKDVNELFPCIDISVHPEIGFAHGKNYKKQVCTQSNL